MNPSGAFSEYNNTYNTKTKLNQTLIPIHRKMRENITNLLEFDMDGST